MSNKNIQQTTFWEFLQIQNHKIEIPIIQRDYAQGRIGKEKLREKFLTDLKNALDGKFANNEKVLKLDFVYGSVENGCLNPLDGQQRLTTLWLLHWYIAFKAGKLSENREIFKNFSYETRASSREFCKKLSDFELKTEKTITDQIQNQTWFLSVWKQDPTVQAMLNMLGGTPIKDSEKNEIQDGIEEVFINCDSSTYVSYWEKLTNKECPIIFYYLDLEGLALSDDLYIKMNARGKPLTNFENFKADLVGFIDEKKWDKGKQPQDTIAHKIDTDWTNIFWKYKSNEHKIDEIYFTFINRYFLNYLVTSKKQEFNYLYSQEQIVTNKLFNYLYGNSGDDSILKYNSFDFYISEKDVFVYKLFERLNNTLDNFNSAFKNSSKDEINSLFLPTWDSKSDFRFIPEYIENKQAKEDGSKYIPITLTLTERVVFYAVCSYFENYQFDEVAFKQWMRIVWNIVENANINSIQSMIGSMRLIDELKSKSNKIYNYLADSSNVIKSDTAKEQVAEEIEKAKQIVKDTTNYWEEKIVEAEKYAFFKGAIRFLFRSDINIWDWSKFDNRYKKSKLYFSMTGLTSDYKKDAILIRYLISCFDKWEQFKPLYYDNEISNWKNVLTHVTYIIPCNKLFDNEVLQFDNQIFISPLKDKLKSFQEDIVRYSILAIIVPGCTFHWWNYGGYYSLYPYNTKSQSKIYVLADERNNILSKLEKEEIIKVDDWQRVEGLSFYKGWELHFTSKLNNKKYQWWYTLKELTENGKWEKVIPDVKLDNLEAYLKSLDK